MQEWVGVEGTSVSRISSHTLAIKVLENASTVLGLCIHIYLFFCQVTGYRSDNIPVAMSSSGSQSLASDLNLWSKESGILEKLLDLELWEEMWKINMDTVSASKMEGSSQEQGKRKLHWWEYFRRPRTPLMEFLMAGLGWQGHQNYIR